MTNYLTDMIFNIHVTLCHTGVTVCHWRVKQTEDVIPVPYQWSWNRDRQAKESGGFI